MSARSFDLGDPAFDVTSAEVHGAREEDWYVETTWGWAVLRYAEVSALLRDRRFRQGNARWPAQNGIHSGLFSDWWQETLLSLEGEDHARIRKLMVPAFKNRVIAELRPTFQGIAHELIESLDDVSLGLTGAQSVCRVNAPMSGESARARRSSRNLAIDQRARAATEFR